MKKPDERLIEIEEKYPKHALWEKDPTVDDTIWLISRIKKLTEALNDIGNARGAGMETSVYTLRKLARKALEEK